MTLKILSYAQHLFGVGHIYRAKRVIEACAARGHQTQLVLGGMPVPGYTVAGTTVHQLPPIRTPDATYSALVDADNNVVTEALLDARRDQLLSLHHAMQPDVILLEGFPLARRKFRFELIPLLDAAHARAPRPLVVVSARDVLQRPAREERVVESLETFRTYCDALLLHGEKDGSGAFLTFPEIATLGAAIHFTGLVGPPVSKDEPAPELTADVVVSAGGGVVGADMIETAIAAKAGSDARDLSWLVLAGPNMDADAFDALRSCARQVGVDVVRFVPNLRAVLSRATLSIQQAGYNTIADLLTTRCRAVIVPFGEHGQAEQPARAQALAATGRAEVVMQHDLSAETLAAAINRALKAAVPTALPAFNGAERSAVLIEKLAAEHAARADT